RRSVAQGQEGQLQGTSEPALRPDSAEARRYALHGLGGESQEGTGREQVTTHPMQVSRESVECNMGHFVGVYTDELARLKSIIGSGSAEHFSFVLQACGGKFYHVPETHDRIARALKEIIAGACPSGVHEDAAWYLYAFQRLCDAVARKWTVQEIY